MPRWIPLLGVGCVGLALALIAEAGKPKVFVYEAIGELDQDGDRIGWLTAPDRFGRGQSSQQGSTIAVDAGGLWIVERNAGALIRTDHAGELRATFPLHEGLGELVRDPSTGSLFVADRRGDRVLRFDTSADQATRAGELVVTEPHGLALTPDFDTLLVTSVAEHELVAVDAATMTIRWRVELAAEPRPVAVSPNGSSALVGFLSSSALARVDLVHADHRVDWHALSPRDPVEVNEFEAEWGPSASVFPVEANSRFDVPNDVGRRHARNVFALAFVGEGIAVAAHQVATPQFELVPAAGRREAYGGGSASVAPIEYGFSRIADPGPDRNPAIDHHRVHVHQPRALAYDPEHDVLYIAGHGDDDVAAIGSVSREHPTLLWAASLGAGPACGIDGLAIGHARNFGPSTQLWVHCELARRVVRIDLDPDSPTGQPLPSREWIRGPELAASLRSAEVERGADLFRREDSRSGGPLVCASCHPEGRSDGLSWRLGRSILQTPMLAGRVGETSPYKWTGEDSTLIASFEHTIERLGGAPEEFSNAEYRAIAAYLTGLAKPRAPSVDDPDALARGLAVFEEHCSACHAGEHSTDRQQHEFVTSLARVDTPSLIGLAHTAPYYHDGSASDLAALLDDRGSVHDMIDSSTMSVAARRDLVVYLESL